MLTMILDSLAISSSMVFQPSFFMSGLPGASKTAASCKTSYQLQYEQHNFVIFATGCSQSRHNSPIQNNNSESVAPQYV